MLCKQAGCPGDMKYFKVLDLEGYRCPVCGFETHIVAHQDVDRVEVDQFKDFISYDEKGNMCIDDGIVEAYFKGLEP
jgi:hypothetical protein